MFGVTGSGDTSGFGGLRLPAHVPAPGRAPLRRLVRRGRRRAARRASPSASIPARRRPADHRRPRRDHVLHAARAARRDLPHPARRRRRCASSCAARCPAWTTAWTCRSGCTSVYHLLSMTYRRRIRLEVAVDVDDPHVPSVVAVYPTADWHERETWDMFGMVFDGHPALTRILMPDDWDGPPAAQGLPARRHPGRVQGRRDPAARPAEVVLVTSTTRTPTPTSAETTEGTVYTVTGGDWDTLIDAEHDERIVINMGPQHPSTHGVLRLVLELEGETVAAGPVGDRLPAHRHREELRVPHLDPGRHVRDAHGLPGADRSTRPATAWRSRSCSASRCRAGRRPGSAAGRTVCGLSLGSSGDDGCF